MKKNLSEIIGQLGYYHSKEIAERALKDMKEMQEISNEDYWKCITHLRTITFNRSEDTDPSKKPLANYSKISLKGLKALPKKQYVIKRFELTKGSLGLLCATGGSGKSMLIQYLACCISSGKNVFGEFEVEQGEVLHLDQEQNLIQTQRRYERIAAGMELDELHIVRVDLNKRLDSKEVIQSIEEELVKMFYGMTLVVIDSLKAVSSADENSADIEVILKILKRVAEKANCAILLIHHKGKSNSDVKQSGRGHSSIYDSVDVQVDLDLDPDAQVYELSCKKNRDGKLFDGIKYQLVDEGEMNYEQNCSEMLKFVPLQISVKKENREDVKKTIMEVINNNPSINYSKLFGNVKGDRGLFEKALEALLSDKFVSEEAGARNSRMFTLTEEGRTQLAWSTK